jgi:hypothetical protein
MRTRLRSKVTLLFMTLGLLLAIPAVAFADQILADVDTVTANPQGSASISVAPGATVNKTVQFYLDCTSRNNHLNPGSTNNMTFSLAQSAVPSGGSLSATNSSITAPSSWPTDGTVCGTTADFLGSNTSTVTITAPSAVGNYTYTVLWNNTDADVGNNTTATYTVNVRKPTSITNVSGTGTEGNPGSASLSATLTSGTDNMSGKNLTFSINPKANVCDNDSGTPLVACPTATVQTDAGGVANANLSLPSTFTAANSPYPFTVSFAQDATYQSASQTGNLVVSAACTNPADPLFQNTPNANGWFTSIPTPNATTTTSGATVKYSDAANGTYSTTPPTLDEGQTTVYAKAFSSTGSCSSAAVSYLFKVDTIAPGVTPGNVTNTTWRNTNLSQAFTATDSGSGLAPSQGLDASGGFTLTASNESANASTPTVVSKTVNDVAGNSTTRSVSALIDKTAPTINANRTPDPNANGWNKTDVTVSYTCSDALSGLDSSGCATDDTVTTEGANQSVSGTVTDKAGNSATATVNDINIDKTAPTINGTLSPANPAASGWYNISTGAPKVSYTCNDALSGLAGTCPADFTFGEGSDLSHS